MFTQATGGTIDLKGNWGGSQ